MSYAILLYLDPASEARLMALLTDLNGIGLQTTLTAYGLRPHLSLAGYETAPLVEMIANLERFARRAPPFELYFSAAGVFPGAEKVLFLAPVVTAGLLELHAALHTAMAKLEAEPHPLYLPRKWFPHLTLATPVTDAEVTAALPVIQAHPVFATATCTQVALISYPPVQQLAEFPLGLPLRAG